MVNISKLDFSGQHLYVGLDVHKKSWSVSILTRQFEHKTFTQPPDPSVLDAPADAIKHAAKKSLSGRAPKV